MAANTWDIILKKLTNLTTFDRAIKIAVQSVLATQKKRIFVDGQDSTGQKIGTYSTDPISISKKNQSRNTGKTYFPGGYAEYKSAVGKNDGYVNWRNTDQMFFDFQFFDMGNLQYGIGFSNEFNFQKSEWLEKKYGKKVIAMSKQEEKILTDVIDYELGKDLQ